MCRLRTDGILSPCKVPVTQKRVPAPCATLIARALIAIAGGVHASAVAAATHICADDRGRIYRMSQPLETTLIVIRCREEPEGIPTGESPLRPATLQALRPDAVSVALPNENSEDEAVAPTAVPSTKAARSTAGKVPTSSATFNALIRTTARRFGLDPALINAIIHVESRHNPRAVSPKGAIGLMQVMPATAQRYGIADPHTQLFKPAINLSIGAQYLADLRRRFAGRTDLVLAAYNAGEAAVEKYGNTVPPYKETQAYVRAVLLAYAGRVK